MSERFGWLGFDFFADVSFVGPRNYDDSMREFADDDMFRLTSGAGGISDLDARMSQVTDAGLVCLDELANLKRLYLSDTRVTDAGLAHLKGLTRLESLEHQS